MIMFRFSLVVLLSVFLLQGCTTAELVVDILKKSKKSTIAEKSDNDGNRKVW